MGIILYELVILADIPATVDRGIPYGRHNPCVWNPYDSHIPLLGYGWNVRPGKTNRETYITDIGPTIAALPQVQMPGGSIGQPIEEFFK